MKKQIIHIDNSEISILSQGTEDYISLTDMAHSQMQEHIIFRWMSLKSTIEYIGEWESLYNPNFNYTEFGTIRNASGSNNFVLSVKTWIEKTNAIGIAAKAGRYGGTYAHKDIAYHFGMWISPRFQLLLVKEYQHLQEEKQKLLGWTAKRELSKINYHIHTDAIKQNLIPQETMWRQPCLTAAFMRLRVPVMLLTEYFSGAVMDSPAALKAARWMKASKPRLKAASRFSG